MPTVKPRRGLPKKPAFLAAYKTTASITLAAKAAKVDRALHYRWLAEDEQYSLDFEAARLEAAQTLEDEAVRRAHLGVLEPLVYQGQFSYKQRAKKGDDGKPLKISGKAVLENYGSPLGVLKYSDALLMFLLRGLSPKFRDSSKVELSGPAGGPIPISDKRLEALSDDELAGLIQISRKLTGEVG